MRRWIILPGVLAVLASVPVARAKELALAVDFGGAALARAVPVTGGVPLARGALTDARAVRLLSGGKPIPLQTKVLAWWPDKSVKWLLLDFQVRPGAKSLTLRYGGGVQAGAAARGIEASADAGGVAVDTGAIAFRVRRDGSGLLDEVSFGGRRIFEAGGRRLNFMDAVHTASPADCKPMTRYVRGGRPDPSRLVLTSVALESPGPLHAVVRIEGKYTYKLVGSTITGTDVKGDCPFRVRLHAYAGQSFVKVEHFFVYEGDGDHDFVRSLGLAVPLAEGAPGAGTIRLLGEAGPAAAVAGPLAGLYQQSPDAYEVWTSGGRHVKTVRRGARFDGVLDVVRGGVGLAVGVKDFWQNAAKSLHADLTAGQAGIYLWPPEACPLDFRRHAREWSVGESGEPDDKKGTTPAPIRRKNYRLASKGVGRTHYAWMYFHAPDEPADDVLGAWRAFQRRPILWAPTAHYAGSLALGRYRQLVPGEHEDLERALDEPIRYWRFSREHFRWYGFWLYGNVCQTINQYLQIGRWERDFGRWGWANGDSVGRLAYGLMLQSVRTGRRADLEFAESYLYHVHDVCSVHTPAYPEHFKGFSYLQGTCHRHGAWPWAGPYTGIRGSHPVGAKIYYFLTGEGHARDILEEVTQLALKRPSGGMGDGPLGPNAQAFLFQWEATGDDVWRKRLHKEIVQSDLSKAKGGWLVMMNAAFGIYNALEEYMDLTGDRSLAALAGRFADEAMPEKMKRHWTRLGYYRVYAAAYNLTGQDKYRRAIEEMLPLYTAEAAKSVASKLPPGDWPGPAGGPRFFADGNCLRDIPFALYSLHQAPTKKEGR